MRSLITDCRQRAAREESTDRKVADAKAERKRRLTIQARFFASPFKTLLHNIGMYTQPVATYVVIHIIGNSGSNLFYI